MAEEIVGLDFERPILELEAKITELKSFAVSEKLEFAEEIRVLQEKCDQLKREIYGSLAPWQRVQIARHPKRLYTLDYLHALCHDFIELHGDRTFSDDAALVVGIGFFGDDPVVVIGHQKGRTVQESMERNFGMPHPEGYRKARRLMLLAEKFSRPLLVFIDTPGAYPGIGAEERGQAQAIAENLRTMASLKTPTLCVIIGEGGSGGALAIGVGDRILMCENAWYSVISPEGCAAILFHDAAKAPEAASVLKLTATDLLEFGVVDEVIPEPLGGIHRDPAASLETVGRLLRRHLMELQGQPLEKLLKERYAKYRRLGRFREVQERKLSRAGRSK
ncbi:MAG: acetyl-CoA carboxylase carboxyltransferase subunit alpha [Elusimicrobia bacterium]|nr:acetyl-CoA carboxylase carboxyltransferase subunit alpha [Elusimicrobiota bacterium]